MNTQEISQTVNKCYPYPETFRVTSPYGTRGGKSHKGIDLVGINNKTIVSCCDGVVTKAAGDGGSGYGNHIMIRNADGSGCLYAHLCKIYVKKGQNVSIKQAIGLEGSTGNSTGSHLHLGVSSNGDYTTTHAQQTWIDPAVWFGLASTNPIQGKVFDGAGYPTGYPTDSSKSTITTITSVTSGATGGSSITGIADAIIPSGESYHVTDATGVYSDWLYGRRYRVLVDTGDGNALDVSELRCNFDITKTAYMEAHQSVLKIYNLSPEDENKLIRQGQTIIIEAGYNGNQYGIIFAGKIIQPIRSRENGVDYVLTLVSMDEEIYAGYGLVNITLVNESNLRDAVEVSTTRATYPRKIGKLIDTSITYPRGKVLFGMPKTFLDNCARSENATYYGENGEVNIIRAEVSEDGTDASMIPSFSPSSGLLDNPSQTEYGISCKILLNPSVTLGSLFHIDNTLIAGLRFQQGQQLRPMDSNGIYRVIKIHYVGDTRGDDWYMEIDAIGQQGMLPGLANDAGTSVFN